MALGPSPDITIRPLTSHDELEAAVRLQRDVWGYEDLDVDSRSMLTIASRFVGQTLGAFDGDKLVGFTLALATLPVGRLHSHRVGVHPEYQNLGIGRRLKLAQRADALARGIPLIQWSFDPLQPRNAYFNLVRLGGVARTYLPNLYGITTSPLHGGLPTDRLLIEWELESERVLERLAGPAPLSRTSHSGDTREVQFVQLLPLPERRLPESQQRLRESFLAYLAEGYVVTGFRENQAGHCYILEKP